MKKLNNKGFTLIELLAVIVILAVVMGVATTSVLNAMNNSRKNSLQNSALSAADSFRAKYAEYSMNPSDGLLGLDNTSINLLLDGTVIKFSDTNASSGIRDKLAAELNITVGAAGAAGVNYVADQSYVYFDKGTSSFYVCLTANSKGSYYVANAVSSDVVPGKGNVSLAQGTMWACSDNTHSWPNN